MRSHAFHILIVLLSLIVSLCEFRKYFLEPRLNLQGLLSKWTPEQSPPSVPSGPRRHCSWRFHWEDDGKTALLRAGAEHEIEVKAQQGAACLGVHRPIEISFERTLIREGGRKDVFGKKSIRVTSLL